MPDSYHHGNLRAVMVDRAVDLLGQPGTTPVSLREVARAAGVSHGAASHHFGDKRGLFTAVAAAGFRRLAEAMRRPGEDFLEVAVEYVRFALGSPRLYTLMFDGSAVDATDAHLRAARRDAGAVLEARVAARTETTVRSDPEAAELAAFSLVHGLATLMLTGAIETPADVDALVRRTALVLFERPE